MQGTCSEEELGKLQRWLRKNSANEDFFKTFVESWEEERPADFKIDARKEWQKFKQIRLGSDTGKSQALSHDEHEILPDFAHVSRRRRLKWYSTVPLAIILFIAAAFFIYRPQFKAKSPQSEQANRIVSTARGERSHLELSDGSTITLNAESSLQVPANFGKTVRMVFLNGEAFFDVAPDASLPFFVISNDSYIRVLGTEFNINAYDSTQIAVAVAEGSVSMGKIEKEKPKLEMGTLGKSELGILNGKGLSVSTIEDMNLFSGWTEGKLVFNNTPLRTVVQRLERLYNIKVRLKTPELANLPLTATYDNLPFSEVAEVLALSLNLTVIHEQDSLVLKTKPKQIHEL